MTRRVRSPLQDRDLLDQLADDPELLAIADGLVATRGGIREASPAARGRIKRAFGAMAAIGVVVALVILVLASPWEGTGSLTSRALAAVGESPVLHVVLEDQSSRAVVVDLKSGRPIPQTLTTEVWFDETRGLKKTLVTVGGRPFDQTLETPDGGFTEDGFVYTCSWIADHPVEAAQARVSCDEGQGQESLQQREPSLDPALEDFVDHYRSALASGKAQRLNTAEVYGHRAIWLALAAPGSQDPAGNSRIERVAIDAETYVPLVVTKGSERFRVREIETLPFAKRFFLKPQRVVRPSSGSVTAESTITPGAVPATLGVPALWLGREWQGLRLVATSRQELVTGSYGPSSKREPTHAVGVEFRYSPTKLDGSASSHSAVIIQEATSCLLAYGWSCSPTDPPNGAIALGGVHSLLRTGPLYVAILDLRASAHPSVLAIAQALAPLSGR